MSDTTVLLTFPAKPDYLLLARLALSGIARGGKIDDELLADLKLAVTEACGNAVRHAYGPEGGDVSVAFTLDGSHLEVVVSDRGKGITLAEEVHADGDGDAALESGMGMPIIRAIVDELEVGAGPNDKGTVVRMVKALGPQP